MNRYTAITIGDIKGIGIDIFLELLKRKKIKNVILFTNFNIIQRYLKNNDQNFKLNVVNINNKEISFKKNYLNIFDYDCTSHYENTYKSIKIAFKYCKKYNFKGLITLPIRKDLIKNNIDKNFTGHTEFLQELDNKRYANMIMYHDKIIISPITTHLKLSSVSNYIKKKNFLKNQILNLYKTLKIDFNIKKPRLIISGLNPHAGENGKIGDEEIKYIKPVINKLLKKNINITGPYPADSMLLKERLKYYDSYIFMFHDQALIPFKMISKFSGINYTGNLSIIRLSPDHGTAYNLKGSKNISTVSLEKCFRLINKININRKKKNKSKKVTKSKFYN